MNFLLTCALVVFVMIRIDTTNVRPWGTLEIELRQTVYGAYGSKGLLRKRCP